MSKEKLGKVIEGYASEKRGLSSPTEIHTLMQQRAPELGRDPDLARSRSTVGKYLKSESSPDEEWLDLFGLVFHLSGSEVMDLQARAQT